jgi:hypothetical protein
VRRGAVRPTIRSTRNILGSPMAEHGDSQQATQVAPHQNIAAQEIKFPFDSAIILTLDFPQRQRALARPSRETHFVAATPRICIDSIAA